MWIAITKNPDKAPDRSSDFRLNAPAEITDESRRATADRTKRYSILIALDLYFAEKARLREEVALVTVVDHK